MSLNDTLPLLVDVALMDVVMASNVLIMVIVGGNPPFVSCLGLGLTLSSLSG